MPFGSTRFRNPWSIGVIASSSDSRSRIVAHVSVMGCSVIVPRNRSGCLGTPLTRSPDRRSRAARGVCSQGYPPPVGSFGESPGIPRARLGITGVKRYPKPALWTNADWRIRSRGRVAPQAFSRFEGYCGVRSAPRTRLLGLTLSHGGRSFNQLTPALSGTQFSRHRAAPPVAAASRRGDPTAGEEE